jgi:hypothetical protein
MASAKVGEGDMQDGDCKFKRPLKCYVHFVTEIGYLMIFGGMFYKFISITFSRNFM